MRLLGFLCLCSVASGQTGGSITGKVVDESGGPVSRATITAISNIGQEFQTATTDGGTYTLDDLAPGAYQLRAVTNAMKTYLVKGVIVELRKTSRLDITLMYPDGNLGTLGEEDRFTANAFSGIAQKPIPIGPTPRLRDGRPDLSGFWIGDPPTGTIEPPLLQPRAEALRSERQRNDMRDLPTARCLPGGIIDPAGRGRFVHTPDILLMLIGPPVVLTYFEVRQIVLDGRPHPKDVNPTWMGHSIGAWERRHFL